MLKLYISLLRGINVAGQKKIPMTDLVALYQKIGFVDVISYIQSGNVIFKSTDSDLGQIANKIQAAILKYFSFTVDVLIKTPSDFQRVVQQNPFKTEQTYITFLWQKPAIIPNEAIKKATLPGEEIKILEDVIYFSCPKNYGKSKLSNNFFEAKFKIPATTRNWKTVNCLLAMTMSS